MSMILNMDPMSFPLISSSILHGPKDLRLESRTIRPPNPLEAQIAILATGLCGSDLHYYNHFRNGDIICQEPLTLGHESAGIITQVGSQVKHLRPGDKVALEVGLPCGNCEVCKSGRYNICREMRFRSSAKAFPHAQGTLQERINHPAAFCHKLPESMSLEMGALIEPLSVAIHANRRAQLTSKNGRNVLVFGAGAVGLLVAAVAKMEGCENVVIADIDQGRVDFAVKNGFAHRGFTVPMRRGEGIEEELEIARENAKSIGECSLEVDRTLGQVDAVFAGCGSSLGIFRFFFALGVAPMLDFGLTER